MHTLWNLLRGAALIAVLAAILFGSAGRWDLPFFWAYLGLNAVLTLVLTLALDPHLLQERWHPRFGSLDLWPWLLLGIPAYLAHLVLAGLDVGRFHCSGQVPGAIQLAGLVVCAASWSWVGWAMLVNRFFVPTVRIQAERGHHLITTGPYRHVRHPGYAGAIAGLLGSPVALGSWLALLPVIPMVLLVIRRTVLEDRFLHKELPGYAEYAGRVRYRLLPGLW